MNSPIRYSALHPLALWLLLIAAIVAAVPGFALDNGLARTPPMGWNSWNGFQLKIDEVLIKSTADALVSSGMRDAGYQYLIVDAGWKAGHRSAEGRLMADPTRFPSGMKSLADYVHSRGLKFGIYTDAGTEDCDGGGPGSEGHEELDARTFADWGVDYVKEDWCKSEGLDARQAYTKMSKGILATGRPMVFSVCEWGDNRPWLWAPQIANLWRTTGDNKDCWDCGAETKDKPGGYPRGWTYILDAQIPLKEFNGPGRWNDPDMLEVGLPGLTMEEAKAHFSLWAILAAPLIAGADVRSMSREIAKIFENSEVIAVDQDRAGKSGTRVAKDGQLEVWARPLSDGSEAVVLFNRSAGEQKVQFDSTMIGFRSGETMKLHDMWKHSDIGILRGRFETRVAPHGVVMLKVSRAKATSSTNR